MATPVLLCDEFLVLEELRGLLDNALRRAPNFSTPIDRLVSGLAVWGPAPEAGVGGLIAGRIHEARNPVPIVYAEWLGSAAREVGRVCNRYLRPPRLCAGL